MHKFKKVLKIIAKSMDVKKEEMFRHVESKLVLLGEAIDIHNELPSMA
jgi:hypothetical protein